jgi:amino acid transporter
VSRAQRRLVVTVLVVFVLGVVVPVVGIALEWYLPLPRRWWGLLLFVATLCLPTLVGYLGVRRLRRLARESNAGRTAQGIVDQTG